eukprot:14247073-Alexandrium_andersonii.AAC.1
MRLGAEGLLSAERPLAKGCRFIARWLRRAARRFAAADLGEEGSDGEECRREGSLEEAVAETAAISPPAATGPAGTSEPRGGRVEAGGANRSRDQGPIAVGLSGAVVRSRVAPHSDLRKET